MKLTLRNLTLLLALGLLAPAAWAHTGHNHGTDGFVQGFMHPFTGLDHLLAMITVGFWAATRRGRLLWGLPVAFMTGMTLGGVMGISGLPLPGVEHGIAASVFVLGLIVAAAAMRVPAMAALGLVALCGLFHGHAHGAEMAAGTLAATYTTGMLLATGLLHGTGLGAIALIGSQAWAPRATRYASAGIACCGVAMMVGLL